MIQSGLRGELVKSNIPKTIGAVALLYLVLRQDRKPIPIGPNTSLVPPSHGAKPSAREIATIQPGSLVKVRFSIPTPEGLKGERMWVKVTRLTSGGGEGILDNDSILSDDFRAGKPVSYRNSDVLEILGEVG